MSTRWADSFILTSCYEHSAVSTQHSALKQSCHGYFPSDCRTLPPELLRNRSRMVEANVLYRSLTRLASPAIITVRLFLGADKISLHRTHDFPEARLRPLFGSPTISGLH